MRRSLILFLLLQLFLACRTSRPEAAMADGVSVEPLQKVAYRVPDAAKDRTESWLFDVRIREAQGRDAEPVGFAAWYRSPEPATTKLDKLYVAIEQHGRGVGRRLLDHVEDAARSDGSGTLILNVAKRNEASIAFYRRCGFSRRNEVVIDIGGGFVMDDYVMAKPL